MIGQEFGGRWASAYAEEYDRLLRIRLWRAFPHYILDTFKGRPQTYPVTYQLESQVSVRHTQIATQESGQEMIRVLRAIEGVGESYAQAIYNEFGSIREILNSPVERLATVQTKSKTIGKALAEKVISELKKLNGEDQSKGTS